MKKIIQRASLICSFILSVVAVSNAQKKVIYYWDFNQTHPSGGGGKDSLGTVYSYANTVLTDSLHKTFTLYSPYADESIPARIEYFRPSANQPNCPNHPKNDRDSILDNGSGGAAINDLHILGNDSGSTNAGNLYIRSRNPSENCYMYMLFPTTGFKNIILNYAISGSSTKMPLYNIFSYSVDGGNTWKNLTTAMDTFNIHGVYRPDTLQANNPTTAASAWYPVHIDFSSDPAVNNNNAGVIVRWLIAGYKPSYLPTDSASCYSSGNERFDNFSILGDSICPYFTLNPANITVCNGGSADFIAKINGGSSLLNIINWQIDSGSGWSDLSNVGIYSGVHTDTLLISNVIPTMNGWGFRCQVLNNSCNNNVSTFARLFVDPYLSDSIIAVTNVGCNTYGSITVGVSGGTSPYTYQWTPGGQTNATATGLSAGSYTVTITDKLGCSGTQTATVLSPANVPQALILSQTNIECNTTGNATVLAVHGTSPYTYLWAPGGQTNATATGLSLGTYTITITDSLGCTGTNSVTITSTPFIRDSIIGLGLYQIIHYWDFNQTPPSGGGGGDSLGTSTYPLPAPYSLIPGGNPRIVYSRPSTKLKSAASRDSILDNGATGAFVNDLNNSVPAISTLLGNDSASGNLFIRSRNPDSNSYMYMYIPTTGYKNIQLNYALSASSTKGAYFNVFSYSTNGGTSWHSLTAAMDTFNSSGHRHPDSLQVINAITSASLWDPININFTSDPNTNNNPNFIVRWYFAGLGSNGASGNDRYDNFSVSGYQTMEECNGGSNFNAIAGVKYGVVPYTYSWSPSGGNGDTATVSAGTYTVTVTDANGCSATSSIIISQPTTVVASITSSTNLLCNGANTGSATASGGGGISPYLYTWSNSATGATATGLSAGTYTITVTDNHGCTGTNSVTITQPSAIRDSISSTNTGCGSNTGTATVGVINGTAPYTYAWSNGQTNATATGLGSGSYTVTITDHNGCIAATSVTIVSPAGLRDSIASYSYPTCNGGVGTATVGVAGGTPAYTYVWTPIGGTNAVGTGLSAGNYTVSVTDNNGCTASAAAVISQPVALRDSIVSVVGPQVVIHYWDFNNTLPANGTGADSLGTSTFPLPAQYTLVGSPKIIYSRPSARQTTPLNCTIKDSIMDNGTPGGYVNDLHILGNDSASSLAGNLFIRSRNPDENSMFYLYLPTTGYSNIEMNYAISASSSKGALYNVFSYSTNGGADGFVNKLTASMDTFNTGGHSHPDSLQMINPTTIASLWYPVHIDFSSDPRINNNPNFILRWEYEGTSSNGSSGNDRYDNISVLGNASAEVCNGSNNVSATAGVKYGTSPYTYLWNPTSQTTATASGLSAGTYTVDITDVNGCTGSASVTITQPTLLTVNISPTNESCNGSTNGTATVGVSGGTAPYTYVWSPGGKTTVVITGLSVGTYTVTVNDHNLCSAIATVTISQPAAISINTSMTAATCNSSTGTATASVSGGTSPYTYVWNPGGQTNATATGLAAGNYTVTVTDNNGCTGTGAINVTGTGENATASVTGNVLCNGGSTGSASSTVTGGTLPYTYLWNPGGQTNANASNLSAGTYTLTVHDNNGCASTAVVTITQPSALKDSLTASGNTIVLHYWDFNQTVTAGGNGGDSLGTQYSYANPYSVDTAHKTGPLYAPYTIIPGNARIVYIRPDNKQTTPFLASSRDSIVDNGSGGSFINDLNKIPAINTVLGNDSTGTNLYIRSRNPDENSFMYLYVPTTGYENVQVNYAIEESSVKGAQFNILSYSTNGGATWNNLPRSVDTFTVGHQPTRDNLKVNGDLNWTGYNLNFSKVAAANNNPNFVIRWSFAGSQSAGASGNDRYDNISVTGNAVTELCSGGNNVDLTDAVSGGMAPYTYSWSPNVSSTSTANNLTAGTYSVTVTDGNGCTGTASLTVSQPALLTASPTETGPLCNGGSTGTATANASGGTAPYSYVWNNSQTNAIATGLSAGSYTVTIKDFNGCTATASVNVTQPNALRDSIASTNNGCFGNSNGTATVGVKYGTGPYTYLWSNSQTNATATGLSAGTYTVLVSDNNGCTATASTNLTQPTQLRDSITASTTVNCIGGLGSATVGVAGGTPAYTYSWSPIGGTNFTGTGLTVGSYTVTLTDKNGCTTSATVTLTQPPSVSITTSIVTNISCNGGNNGSASVTVNTGTAPFTYLWTPSSQTTSIATGLSTGTYTISVYDNNGCSATASINMSQPAAIRDSVSSITEVKCEGGNTGAASIGVKGGFAPYTYSWSPNSNSTNTATGLSAGSYTVTVTDNHGCGNTVGVTITQPAVVKDSLVSISYPACNGGFATATIGVIGGIPAYTYTWTHSVSTTATATNLTAGTYTVTVKDHNGCTGTTAIVVTQPNAIHDSIVKTLTTYPACNGGGTGTATVGVKYGTVPYTYLWSPGGQTNVTATGLSAGTYSVTVKDNNGCTGTTATLVITQPGAIRDSASSIVEVKCNGGNTGSITIGVKYGTAPYTYAWSPNVSSTKVANAVSAGTYTITITDKNGCSSTLTVTITQPSIIRDSLASVTYPVCNLGSGSATIGVKGGVSPYTYTWNPSVSTTSTAIGLTARSYTVTVKDNNGCSQIVTFSITQPNAIHDSIVKALTVNATCNGLSNGSATVGVKYGTSPYTYTWSPNVSSTSTASGLSAGTYSVTVIDKNGCTSTTATVTITQPGVIRDSISAIIEVTCNGNSNGKATVGVKYGTAPYTYLWTPTAKTTATVTGLSAGTYSVTVTDKNGCTGTIAVALITQPTLLRDSLVSTTNAVCAGSEGSATIGVKGGTLPYTYTWSPNVSTTSTCTTLSAGTYTVTVKDYNGCSDAPITFTILQITPIRDSIIASSVVNNICNGGNIGSATVGVKYGTAPYTYLWSPGGQTTSAATALSAGTYTVTITDNNGCSNTTSVTITQPAAIKDSVSAMAGPSCNGERNGTATIGTTGGVGPYTYSWSPNTNTTATATGLSARVFTVTVTDHNGCIVVFTFTETQPGVLRDSISAWTNVGCGGGNNGSATVGVKYGTSPYTYSWTNGQTTATITGLSAGTYVVNVTDANGCTTFTNVRITQNYVMTDSVTLITPSACYGQNVAIASVGVRGGSSPYTYLWSPGGQTKATATGLSVGNYTVTIMDKNGCSNTVGVTITQPALLRDSIANFVNPPCYGTTGSAIVGVAGGTSPYTYDWARGGNTNANATGLSAATYTITVKDNNGCSTSASIILTQPLSIHDSIVKTSTVNVLCYGSNTGSATVGTKFGTPPYTYLWTPGGQTNVTATGLSVGTYSVTVTDNHGCTGTTSTVIISGPFAAIRDSVVTLTEDKCNGGNTGSVNVGVKYGTAPYTYTWSPNVSTTKSASGLSAGLYTLTITDKNGCSSTLGITITQPSVVHDSVAIMNQPACNGEKGSVTIGVRGGTSPYTYTWAPVVSTMATATGLSVKSYTVTVTDHNGCTSAVSFSITQPSVMHDSVVSSICPGGSGGTVTSGVRGGTPSYTYLWTPGGGTNSTMTGLSNGTYTITVTDSHGCTATTAASVNCISSEGPVGSGVNCCPPNSLNSIDLYPNPTTGEFTITGVQQGQIIQLYNYEAKMIKSVVVDKSEMHLNISDQPNGLYLIRILNNDGALVTQKKLVKTW